MINQVLEYIKENKMLTYNDKVIVGVSGGADSVCLFFVLLELKKLFHLDLYVIHVNHGLRGLQAKEDACYVEELSKKYQVNFTLIQADIKELAKKYGISEEESGRNVRYEAFEQVCQQYQGNKIAIAHNMNDRAETALFNLFRGSGIKGLTGISPVRDNIIRPLLCVSRQQIEHYLAEKNISFCQDATNFQTEYTRNKLRLKVLPYVIENINSKAIEHIVQTSVMLDEVESYLEKNIMDCYLNIVKVENGQYSFLTEEFLQQDIVIQKGIIRMIIKELAGRLKDITSEHVDMVLSLANNSVGKSVNLPYHMIGTRGYEDISLYIEKKDSSNINEELADSNSVEIQVPGNYFLKEMDQYVEFSVIKYKKNLIIPRNGCTKWFDYDKIENTVILRTRKIGDFIQIDHKGSKKKLKSYFIDKKIPREDRDHIPLVADGNHIMWIIGDRISEAYKIDKDTKNILMVKLYGGKEDGA